MGKKKNTRASNGMGSIRQRKDGTWEARYTAPDGRQKSLYGKTEKEVTAKLRGTLHDIDRGTWREPSRMTLGEWLDIWMADYQGHTTGRTMETYACAVRRWFRPQLGDVRMAALSQMHVRRLVSAMEKAGRAPSTIRHHMAILGAACRAAVEAGILRENPVEGVRLKKRAPVKFHVVDREQIPAFIAAAQGTPYPGELVFMLLSGLRVGEVRGLRWSDIDFDAGTVSVERQLHPKAHKLGFAQPKNGERREIHLAPEALDVLRAQKKRQAEQRLAAGPRWVEDDLSIGLVFRRANGKPHSESSIYNAAVSAGQAIGIPGLHPHDLRHSYAVAALRSGVDVKTVQHNLGHRSAQMTLDIYAAYTDDAGKAGAQILSRYLKKALD